MRLGSSSGALAPPRGGGSMIRDCIICGRSTILARYIDNAMVVMDAEPVTDGQAVLKGNLTDQPTVLFGIDAPADAEFWHVPFDSDRYDKHQCRGERR